MDRNLINFIKILTTRGEKNVQDYLWKIDKQKISNLLINITHQYLVDKNSSTLRQVISAVIAGYKPNLEKLGFNGKKIGKKDIFCEIKPVNINTGANKNKKLKLRKIN